MTGRGESFDVVVVGGGPAGSTCAYHLASRGRSVLLLDKTHHPRFRVGESLVPSTTRLLESMGVLDQMVGDPFVVKHSVQSADSEGGYFRTYFRSLPEGQSKFGFNVERSAFDTLLWEHAQRAGADVVEEAEVSELLFEGARLVGVIYERDGERHEVRARFVADATGRAGLVARHLNLRRMNRRLRNVALFQYFDDVVEGVNAADEGDLVISTHADGWIWCIPVGPDTRSVGTVMPVTALRGRKRQAVFDDHLARAPLVAPALEGSRPCFPALKVESDFCYHSEELAGPGWFLVGDAGCFVDPVFSGGVFLGMVAAMKAADAIDDVCGGRDDEEAARHYENFCKTGYDHYFRLVYAFYEACEARFACLFGDLLPGYFKRVLQILAGDFWSDEENPIWTEFRSRSDWDTFQRPFSRAYGCPIYPGTSNPPARLAGA